jgi:hypothetical protein
MRSKTATTHSLRASFVQRARPARRGTAEWNALPSEEASSAGSREKEKAMMINGQLAKYRTGDVVREADVTG